MFFFSLCIYYYISKVSKKEKLKVINNLLVKEIRFPFLYIHKTNVKQKL